MVLSKKARMTENIREREAEVKLAIETKSECRYLYVVTFPSNEKNLLDIHPYRELYKRKEYDRPFVILGLAENRKAAVQIVVDLVQEIAAETEHPEEFKSNFIALRDSFLPEPGVREGIVE